jgi:hypothetical protein
MNMGGTVGHVYVQFTDASGDSIYLDPSSRSVLTKIPDTQFVLFTYDSDETRVVDKDFNYSKLVTAGYEVELDETVWKRLGYDNYEDYYNFKQNILTDSLDSIAKLQALLDKYALVSMGMSDEYNTIKGFIDALTNKSMQPLASADAVLTALNQLAVHFQDIINYANVYSAANTTLTTATSTYNTAVTNYNNANTAFNSTSVKVYTISSSYVGETTWGGLNSFMSGKADGEYISRCNSANALFYKVGSSDSYYPSAYYTAKNAVTTTLAAKNTAAAAVTAAQNAVNAAAAPLLSLYGLSGTAIDKFIGGDVTTLTSAKTSVGAYKTLRLYGETTFPLIDTNYEDFIISNMVAAEFEAGKLN